MSLSQTEAADCLREANEAEQRSVMLRRYQGIAPHLMRWGGIYALAYTIGFFLPAKFAGAPWMVLGPAGGLGGFLIARRFGGRTTALFPAAILAILAFIIACLAIMAPRDPNQVVAFVPLVISLVYMLWGLAIGPRLVVTGAALGVLTVFGFFVLPGLFLLWMAVCAGGGLALGGFWLARV
jgi:hypothetical protein